tara:strand:+ start:420 stop:1478 length:1059 start_codon:yes stop_codon:yes gene_type:complete
MDSDTNNVTPIKKKRGRKPKNKDKVEEPKIPKKRGRKPTGKIISLKNNEFSSLQHDDNCIIAHIPLKQSDIDRISNNSAFSSVDDKINSIIDNNSDQSDSESITELSLENNTLGNNKKNFSDKYITHLETEIINYKVKIKKLEETINSSEIFFGDYSVEKLKSQIVINENNEFILVKNTDILCWWCCHSFNNTPFPLPEKLYENKYHVFGNFCSPSCACAFNIDMNDHKLWERNSLVLKLYNDLTKKNIENIYPAPPKQILKKFGGNLTIDEFRNKTKNVYSSRFIIPPMVPLTTLIEESYKDRNKYKWETKVNMSKYNNLKKNIKIKRNTSKGTDNNLEKIMGLKKIKIDS